MSDTSTSSSSGIGFAGLLAIAFIVLKLCGVIAWSWWWVLSPLWIGGGGGAGHHRHRPIHRRRRGAGEAMNTSEVLDRAADLIEERGWTHGTGWNLKADPTAPLCLEGGEDAALGAVWDDGVAGVVALYTCPARNAVEDYLGMSPHIWNDRQPWAHYGNPHCSQAEREAWAAEQVIATLRAAAVIESARETATSPKPAKIADERVAGAVS